jgi:hypothetical protein
MAILWSTLKHGRFETRYLRQHMPGLAWSGQGWQAGPGIQVPLAARFLYAAPFAARMLPRVTVELPSLGARTQHTSQRLSACDGPWLGLSEWNNGVEHGQ